ncbi:IucA/IucC family protein [Halobacillus rhizosphaerae]|uniref:IucA/IucC family protein n=1 Tax=Halobacillus rhizosphaerae TaxID=3064889 RepID=UPI00398A9048
MRNTKQIAEEATIQSFINCYLRETDNYMETERPSHLLQIEAHEKTICIPLERQEVKLLIPVKYWSLTGRHLLGFPLYYQLAGKEDWLSIDYVTLITLVIKEWLIEQGKDLAEDELIHRVILSCKKIHKYVEQRISDRKELTGEEFTFIDAEQSLLFGHLLHPTPKSKQGLTEQEDILYSPEHKGRFQLHYFNVDPSLVVQDSALSLSASELILDEMKESVDAGWIEQLRKDQRMLIPVHPLQVPILLEKPSVKKHLGTGAIQDVGPMGDYFTATSSFRTVYSPESNFMYKFSVPIKITNSLRVNQPKELARGVEVSKLLKTNLGSELKLAYPHFHLIQDPAYMNLQMKEEISGFELVVRENPFYENSDQTTLIAALVHDSAYDSDSRIHSIISGIAHREERSLEEVSLDWFNNYLNISLEPILWLFDNYGIALEAHQQNSIIQLKGGYPENFYYRDNQGYYFCKSRSKKLEDLLPDLNEESDTICDDEVAEERLRYYFFYNHLFGLINGFGASRLIEEGKLLDVVKAKLKSHSSSRLLTSLLEEPVLPCKANLLTRMYDMDELTGPMESQSIYTEVNNPLVTKEKCSYEL